MAEYTNTTEMSNRLGKAVDKGRLQLAISASAGVIEDVTGGRRGRRTFDLAPVATSRLFRVYDCLLNEPGGPLLLIDDIGSTDGLVVEVGDNIAAWQTITTAGYSVGPLNALAKGEPITELRRVGGYYWWPDPRVADPLVRIVARWGWPVTPHPIRDANRILAERYYRRKDAPWGIAGFGESGLARLQREDPDVALMLRPYLRDE